MKMKIALAALALLTLSTGAFAQVDNQPAAPQAQQPVVVEQQTVQPAAQQAPAPATECEVAAQAPKKAAKKKRAVRPCNVARPVRAAAPAVKQTVEPVVHTQRIIERTEIQRIIVNRPTIVIQSPPTIVRQPTCVRCAAPRPVANICNGPTPGMCPTGSASAAPSVGKMTGAAGNCPAGTPVGQPYKCDSSSTGYCICK